jgi:hypothetical protein
MNLAPSRGLYRRLSALSYLGDGPIPDPSSPTKYLTETGISVTLNETVEDGALIIKRVQLFKSLFTSSETVKNT